MNKKKKGSKIRKFPVRKINKQISEKLVGLFFVVILALVCLTVGITVVNATNGDEYKRIVLQNTQQQYRNRTLVFKRGDILDRNGTILATSERVYKLVLDCRVINYEKKDEEGKATQPYVEPTVEAVVEFFGCDREEIYERLTNEETKNSQYYVVRDDVTMQEKEAFEEYLIKYDNLTNDEKEKLSAEQKEERNKIANINGVWFEDRYLRIYPQGSIACDLIGFSNSANTALWGIEGYYSDVLNGVDGRSFGSFNDESNVEQNTIPAVDGNNVVSTVDVNIQQIIRKAIEDFQAQYSSGPNNTNGAQNIAVIVMDPNNGEVLGMDSSGWYDLNDPQDLSGIYGADTWKNMTEEEKNAKLEEAWINYCISNTFEPGSTAKPMTVAAALASNSIQKTDRWTCDGYEMINGLMIRCAEYPNSHGEMDTAGGLVNSCNDALMQISGKLGAESFLKYQSMFNLGKKTGIDLPGEKAGILYSIDNMGTVELATSSFGQGFTCTMIQEAAAISSLINGGYYCKPHVVKSITDSSGNLLENKSAVVERQVVSGDVSNYIRETLGEAVRSGTGQTAKVPGYSMGGKTGTAQKIPRDSGNYLVSFIGFAPLDDPKVLVYVVVDEPNVEKQDSSVYAQGIAKQIFTELLPYMNIFVDNVQEKEEHDAEQKWIASQIAELEQEKADTEAAANTYSGSLAGLGEAELTERAQEIAQMQADYQNRLTYLQDRIEALRAQLDKGTEKGISDATVPGPSPGEDTEVTGGNGIYSDGVDNNAY